MMIMMPLNGEGTPQVFMQNRARLLHLLLTKLGAMLTPAEKRAYVTPHCGEASSDKPAAADNSEIDPCSVFRVSARHCLVTWL